MTSVAILRVKHAFLRLARIVAFHLHNTCSAIKRAPSPASVSVGSQLSRQRKTTAHGITAIRYYNDYGVRGITLVCLVLAHFYCNLCVSLMVSSTCVPLTGFIFHFILPPAKVKANNEIRTNAVHEV